MAYLIRSSDGRLRICTFTLKDAADHVRRLREQGRRVTVTEAMNGKRVSRKRMADPMGAVAG